MDRRHSTPGYCEVTSLGVDYPMLSIESIISASRRIHPFVNKTPILSSSLLNHWLGHKIFFKAECLQKIGAFKARGACNTIAWLRENNKLDDTAQSRPRIIANSSGNHAQAVAWAASQFKIPATVYMPENVSTVKARATAAYGAEVVFCKNRLETDAQVTQAAKQDNVYWVPPYNHEQVVAGQGTAVFEALSELGEIDAVFAPCGGGGLLSGSLIAARALSPHAAVIGAEPRNANDAAESRRKGSIQTLQNTPQTLADGAMTLAVGDITFEYLKQLDEFYEVSEADIAYWCQWLNHLLKVRIEPTGALSMAAVKQWLAKQSGSKTVLVVLSGGNMDGKTAQKLWCTDYLTSTPCLTG